MTPALLEIGGWILVAGAIWVVAEAIYYYVKAGKSSLYTSGGSPVNVDQVDREERVRVLRSINVHKAVSPHVDKHGDTWTRYPVAPPHVRRIK